ncbi:MAG: bacterioferritin [Burkholderiaceae bacterium]|jgi:bacterioferritin|nr:bacterioferritin [Burkholderiaceae bacterium]MEB2351029.1 bacterioferritin [Burkholderiaceae bacterium]
MKRNPQVVQDLNEYVSFELTGHRQYLLHGAMCRHWGFAGLAQAQLAYSEEETRHAARIMIRILLLGGTPLMQDNRDAVVRGAPVEQYANAVPGQLGDDRNLVGAAIVHLKGAIVRCEQHGDFVSRDLLVEMLDDEEQHLDWLDRQLGLIDKVGLQNYLQTQV